MTVTEFVPSWLTGTWTRSYIRRVDKSSGKDGCLGEPDSTVEVKYIQTPYCFVDVRRPPVIVEGSKEGPMSFAGVTTIISPPEENSKESKNTPLVSWHACLEMGCDDMDCLERWFEADNGSPRSTEDQGHFEDVSKEIGISNAFRENDPQGTLEELWIKIDDGDNEYLAAREEKELIVVAGKYFGYANQDENIFVSGHFTCTKTLLIDMSATDANLEGTVLELDKTKDWVVMPGSTVGLEILF